MTDISLRARRGFAILAVILGLGGFVSFAPKAAEAHSTYCVTHFSPTPGPGAKRHTTGNFGSGQYADYKITVVETLSFSGYWYVSSSFRRDCR
jgi:hypothetical protein